MITACLMQPIGIEIWIFYWKMVKIYLFSQKWTNFQNFSWKVGKFSKYFPKNGQNLYFFSEMVKILIFLQNGQIFKFSSQKWSKFQKFWLIQTVLQNKHPQKNVYNLWKIWKVENFSKIEFQKFKVRFRMYNPTSDEFGEKVFKWCLNACFLCSRLILNRKTLAWTHVTYENAKKHSY